MDKLQEWLRRIQRPPRREVANIDYWALLTETRIAQEAGMPAESAYQGQPWEMDMKIPRAKRRGK